MDMIAPLPGEPLLQAFLKLVQEPGAFESAISDLEAVRSSAQAAIAEADKLMAAVQQAQAAADAKAAAGAAALASAAGIDRMARDKEKETLALAAALNARQASIAAGEQKLAQDQAALAAKQQQIEAQLARFKLIVEG
jgi:hypothetical protein